MLMIPFNGKIVECYQGVYRVYENALQIRGKGGFEMQIKISQQLGGLWVRSKVR